jgi:uncharacterized membrane protein
VSRLRVASKTPLAVAGILATPLFFVGLMAFSLKLDEPSHHFTKKGVVALGDPTKATVGKIYTLALAVSIAVVAVGLLATLLRSRLAVAPPALAAIVATVLLVLPLSTWRDEHTARYPLGTDLIPASNPGDLILRGEWEQNAYTTARQIGFWTIVMAVVAIALTIVFELRRRRGIVGPPVPLPPEVAAGEPQVVPRSSAPY